jgi:acyl carrier protein
MDFFAPAWVYHFKMYPMNVKTSLPAIRAKIEEIVDEKLVVSERLLTDETSFTKDLQVDSLDQYELIMEVEKVFQIKISDEKAEKITTLGGLVACVNTLINED